MRRVLAAALALALGIAWFSWLGPAAGNGVRQLRAEAARSLGTGEIRRALRTTGTRPSPEVRELLALAAEAEARESDWNLAVAAQLRPEQRQHALALEPEVEQVAPRGDMRFVEPELPALAEALLRTYGMATVELPEVPTADAWPGVDRRRRARGLIALVEARELDEEQAHVLLGLTLAAMDQQVDRARVERSLGDLLPDAVRAAVLEERYARGSPGGRP